jgi:ketosteroid isomerase-like protein
LSDLALFAAAQQLGRSVVTENVKDIERQVLDSEMVRDRETQASVNPSDPTATFLDVRGSRQRRKDLPFPGVGNTDHTNAVAYRRTADAFRSGDQALLASLIDAEVVWHVPGTHVMAGDIRGRDALLAWFARLRPKGFWLTEHDVFGNDDHVCALSIMGARRDGVDVRTRVVSVFHYHDGRQVERWFYPEDPVAWDAIFAD